MKIDWEGAGNNAVSSIFGGLGGMATNAIGGLFGMGSNKDPIEEALRFMDQAYPNTTPLERLSGGGGGAAEMGKTQALGFKQIKSNEKIAQMNVNAQKDVARIQQGAEGGGVATQNIKESQSRVEKIHAEVANAKATLKGQELENQWKAYRKDYWSQYVNAETAVPLHKVPFSNASSETLNAFADWMIGQGADKEFVQWSIMPKNKNAPKPSNKDIIIKDWSK